METKLEEFIKRNKKHNAHIKQKETLIANNTTGTEGASKLSKKY